MVDTAGELFTAKLVAAALLSVASFVGLLAPFWVFRFLCVSQGTPIAHLPPVLNDGLEAGDSDGGGAASSKSAQEASLPGAAAGGIMVSFANCVSAGILLWTGQMHFFVESASSFASPSLCPMAQAGQGTSLGAGGLACMEYAVGRTSVCFICGILIPLVVERVVWPWTTERMSQSAAAPSALQNAHGHHNDDSIAAAMVAHAHSHSHAMVVHPPARNVRKENGNNSRGTTPVQLSSSGAGKKALASAILIAILMSVHSATEGVAVGVEPSIRSLRASVSPLVVHKMFDGWLVGIGAYRTADAFLRTSGTLDVVRHLFLRAPQRYSLWIWLAALPATLMAVACIAGPAPADALDAAPTDGGHYHNGATFSVAVAQATSSGSFLYVAVCAILLEEMAVTDGHHHHHVPHQQVSTIKRNSILLVGCLMGLMLGSILSGHE